MRILIDGDGCPVIDLTINIAKKFNIDVIIMCDTSHVFNKEGVKTMVFSKGADSVDFALTNFVKKNDIVITQDYGLAAMTINKAYCVINQNGLIYTNDNIDMLLYNRYISSKIRKSGGRVRGPKKRSNDDNMNFEKCLIKVCKSFFM